MVKHLISQVLCQQNLHVTILYYYQDIINYRDNMAITYQDIGFAIIVQPYLMVDNVHHPCCISGCEVTVILVDSHFHELVS